MPYVANTEKLTADGVITEPQAREIERRSRDLMVQLAINSFLCAGIIAATFGLIFWLADPLWVSVSGGLGLILGLFILAQGSENLKMFGNAAALIGAGLLIGGAGIELVDKYEDIAGPTMFAGGALLTLISAWRMKTGALTARFVTGSILLMGLALHLTGLFFWLNEAGVTGLSVSVAWGYAALAIAAAGVFTDVRLVTALAIAPFAQLLDTGTAYFHAAYVFYSPEPTLSIIQMVLLIIACLWVFKTQSDRYGRHAMILAILAFVVANLCALVGSLWGDWIGDELWQNAWRKENGWDWEAMRDARDVWQASAIYISEHVFTAVWALALIATIAWAAFANHRGLFNTAMTFAGLHAYTQLFESFGDEPWAWAIGGLAAIPAAWGLWKLDQWITTRRETLA